MTIKQDDELTYIPRLATEQISLVNQQGGRVVMSMTTDDEGRPRIVMNQPNSLAPVIAIVVEQSGPKIFVNDKYGRPRITVYIDDDESPQIVLYDTHLRPVAALPPLPDVPAET